MRNEEPEKLFEVPRIKLILAKEESFYDTNENDGSDDPFNNLRKALIM